MYKYFFQNFPIAGTKGKKMKKKKKLEQKPEMGYCPFEHWLGWAQGARHGTSAGARALGQAGRQAGRRGSAGRAGAVGARGVRGIQAGACGVRAAGARRALGTRAGCRRAAYACWLGCGLCTWCTQPVLTQSRLSTVPESIFGKNFWKKKIYIFEKKNQIKLDKIFEKIKFSKMKFLLIKMICLK